MAFWDKWWKDSKRQETEPAVQDTVEEEKVLEEEAVETPVEAVTVETPVETVTAEVQEPVEEKPEPEAPTGRAAGGGEENRILAEAEKTVYGRRVRLCHQRSRRGVL